MFIRKFVLKVLIMNKKLLTGLEIIDCIAEKLVSVIIQVRKETK